MGAVEWDSVKSARKAKDVLHKACEKTSETREWTLHGQEQNIMCIACPVRESRDSDRFLVSTQHALLRQGFGTSVPFICYGKSDNSLHQPSREYDLDNQQ